MIPDDEMTTAIRDLVRAGFEDRDRIIEILCHELYKPGTLDPVVVSKEVDRAINTHERSKDEWPETTDCDRLADAFISLSAQGVIAMHNAGFTKSDGLAEFRNFFENHPSPEDVVGFCYYHSQDVERALRGGGLYIGFGPRPDEDEDTEGKKVGRMVATDLATAGLVVEWDGSFDARILLPNFVWQRR